MPVAATAHTFTAAATWLHGTVSATGAASAPRGRFSAEPGEADRGDGHRPRPPPMPTASSVSARDRPQDLPAVAPSEAQRRQFRAAHRGGHEQGVGEGDHRVDEGDAEHQEQAQAGWGWSSDAGGGGPSLLRRCDGPAGYGTRARDGRCRSGPRRRARVRCRQCDTVSLEPVLRVRGPLRPSRTGPGRPPATPPPSRRPCAARTPR